MPICTFYDKFELENYLEDFYLKEDKYTGDLLRDVRKIDPDIYVIRREIEIVKRAFFTLKKEINVSYEVIHKLDNSNLCQIMNFHNCEGLKFNYDLDTICAYLYGIINGYNIKRKNKNGKNSLKIINLLF